MTDSRSPSVMRWSSWTSPPRSCASNGTGRNSGMSFDRAAVEEKGLINMPDCPGKFRQIRESLKVLLEQVDRKHLKWYHLNGGYRGCSGCSNLLDDPSEFE